MKTVIALAVFAAACGDNLGPTQPDATVQVDAPAAPPDAPIGDAVCAMPAYEPIACHPTLPGAACPRTFVLDSGARGCCIVTAGSLHFFPCQ